MKFLTLVKQCNLFVHFLDQRPAARFFFRMPSVFRMSDLFRVAHVFFRVSDIFLRMANVFLRVEDVFLRWQMFF